MRRSTLWAILHEAACMAMVGKTETIPKASRWHSTISTIGPVGGFWQDVQSSLCLRHMYPPAKTGHQESLQATLYHSHRN
jgi:hypothetical protein